jgi:hypothetical protein
MMNVRHNSWIDPHRDSWTSIFSMSMNGQRHRVNRFPGISIVAVIQVIHVLLPRDVKRWHSHLISYSALRQENQPITHFRALVLFRQELNSGEAPNRKI